MSIEPFRSTKNSKKLDNMKLGKMRRKKRSPGNKIIHIPITSSTILEIRASTKPDPNKSRRFSGLRLISKDNRKYISKIDAKK